MVYVCLWQQVDDGACVRIKHMIILHHNRFIWFNHNESTRIRDSELHEVVLGFLLVPMYNHQLSMPACEVCNYPFAGHS